jgi:hypothetical protein
MRLGFLLIMKEDGGVFGDAHLQPNDAQMPLGLWTLDGRK